MADEVREERVNQTVALAGAIRESVLTVMAGAASIQRRNAEFATRVLGESLEEFGKVAGSSASLAEENARIARSLFGSSTDAFERQAGIGRETTRTLIEQSEKQRIAYQTLARQSVDLYMGFLFAPFSGSGQPEEAEGEGRVRVRGESESENGLPIEGYDLAGVEDVLGRLDRLTASQIEQIKAYERRNKKRKTLLERLDAVSASRRRNGG